MSNHKPSLVNYISMPIVYNNMSTRQQEKNNVNVKVTTQQAKSWAKNNANFMTPRIASMTKIKSLPNTFVELSTGEFLDQQIWGISIIEYNTEESKFKTSDKFRQFAKMKYNMIGAEEYLKQVIETLELIGKATIWR